MTIATVSDTFVIKGRGHVAAFNKWPAHALPKTGSFAYRLRDWRSWQIVDVAHYAVNKSSWEGRPISVLLRDGADVKKGDALLFDNGSFHDGLDLATHRRLT